MKTQSYQAYKTKVAKLQEKTNLQTSTSNLQHPVSNFNLQPPASSHQPLTSTSSLKPPTSNLQLQLSTSNLHLKPPTFKEKTNKKKTQPIEKENIKYHKTNIYTYNK